MAMNASCQVLFQIGQVILERKIFKFRQCILLFFTYLPLEKGGVPQLNNLKFPLPKDA